MAGVEKQARGILGDKSRYEKKKRRGGGEGGGGGGEEGKRRGA